MPLKGIILPGHIPVNKYQLIVIGLPPLTVIKHSGLDEELEKAEMPDRTVQSQGNTKSVELTIEIPLHHVIEQAAMELWYRDCKDPVVPGYKKPATMLHMPALLGPPPRTFGMDGVFICGRKSPEGDMTNDSDAATVEWKLSVDDVNPI